MIEAQALGDKYNKFTLMHEATFREEVSIEISRFGHRPVKHMNALGCLQPTTYLNHMTTVGGDEVLMMVERQTKICEKLSASLKLSKGITQTDKHVEMWCLGLTVCLGCDGSESSDFADMVCAIYLAVTIPRDAHPDAKVMTKEPVIEMGTIEGTKATDGPDQIGSLEPGKRGLVTIFEMHRLERVPLSDPLARLIHSASGDSTHAVNMEGRS